MKLAAKIINIVTLIILGLTVLFLVGIGLLFILLPTLSGGYYEDATGEVIIGWVYGIVFLIYAIPCIIPFILGILITVALDKSKNKTTVLVWGIVSVICFNTISGILMIIYATDEKNFPPDYSRRVVPTTQVHVQEEVKQPASQSNDLIAEKLTNLKKLKDEGVITQEEFEECKKSLISKL